MSAVARVEGERPATPGAPPLPEWERRLVIGADRAIYWMTRHWAFVFNGLFLTIVGLAVASPLLRAAGMDGLGQLIFRAYRVTCHQLPERSFFIDGHQVAFCQRDVGVQMGLFLGGGSYACAARTAPRFWSPGALLSRSDRHLGQLLYPTPRSGYRRHLTRGTMGAWL